MELRTGIEIEAAGLAAERASPAQVTQDRRLPRGRSTARSSAARIGGRSGLRVSLQHRGCHRQSAIPALPRNISGASSFRVRRFQGGPGATQARLQEKFQEEHRDNRAAIRAGAVHAGARGDAPASAQQPQALSEASRPSSSDTGSQSQAGCKQSWSRERPAASARGCASC